MKKGLAKGLTRRARGPRAGIGVVLLLCGLGMYPWGSHRGLLEAQVEPSSDPVPLVILLTKLDQGDVAGAERLMGENLEVVKQRLEGVLGELDRQFDQLGRYGATSGHEVHTEVLENFLEDVGRYKKLFEVYRDLSGDEVLYKRIEARRLRFEGALYTHAGEDECGDHLDWEEAQRLYNLALERLEAGFALAEEVEELRVMVSAKNNMGSTFIRMVQPDRGLAAYQEALDLATRMGGNMYPGMVRMNIGNTHVWVGDPDLAMEYLEPALEAFQRMGRGTWQANAMLTIANVHMRQGDFDSAWESLGVTLELATQSGEDRVRGRVLMNLGMAGLQLKKPEAMAFVQEGLEWYAGPNGQVYPDIEREVMQQDGLRLLSRVARETGDEALAEQYMKEFYESVGPDPERYEVVRASPCFAIYKAMPKK